MAIAVRRKTNLPPRPPREEVLIPHLFDCWSRVAPRIRSAKQIRLYLDFDGTLASYRPKPDQAKLTGNARRALRDVADNARVHVTIVSGRRRAQLVKRLRLPGVKSFGLYGWERAGSKAFPAKVAKMLASVRREIGKDAAGRPAGVLVEDKGISVAYHFRGASRAAQREAQARIEKVIARHQRALRVIRSLTSWEIVPRRVGTKGDALRKELKRIGKRYLPIYVGDDTTDEPAFRALRRGITVVVGPARRSSAHFRLRDTREVSDFLQRLKREIS
jgi:trehalose 6-phosphate phosphatase